MGDLKRAVKRNFRSFKKTFDSVRTAVGLKQFNTAEPKPIPMPDEEELLRAKRRKAPRSTGRASTILSDDSDSLGLGG